MLSTQTITINTKNGEREIFIAPFSLHSKTRPDLKPGSIHKLHFYDQLRDDAYEENLKQEVLPDKFRSDEYIINYGQDFEQYYLGSLNFDFETRRYWQWEGKQGDGLNDEEVKTLGESLFAPQSKMRNVVMLTPTRPSDFNLGII